MLITKVVNTGIIILAAGESSRLGSPKQLLEFNNKYLLQYIIDISLASLTENVVLVLGAYENKIKTLLDLKNIKSIHNPNWKVGMSSSIQCGLEAILKINPDIETVVFVLCDQPYLSTTILNEIITKHLETGTEIVNCHYTDSFGPPVLFHKCLFKYLKLLKGNEGAIGVVKQFHEKVSHVNFPKGDSDIDTMSDYHKLLQNYAH